MKKKKLSILISTLSLALTVSMSGCTVSISFENGDKKTAETTEITEKKEKTEKEKGTEAIKEVELTATPVPQKVEQAVPRNQYPTYYVINCKQSITLRPQPDVNSGEILQIPLGSAVSYIETAQNGFYKVIYNGSTGYALASYLSSTKPAETAAAALAQTNVANYETYYVVNCNESITLRPQPDVNSGEICQVPLGSAVSYVGTASNGFYEIIYNGNRGYSLASYLSSSSGSSSYSTCRVVNCNESITLRPQPDVDSGEICQIPLGSTVSYVGTASNGFYEIYYMGQHGYSLADYLAFE